MKRFLILIIFVAIIGGLLSLFILKNPFSQTKGATNSSITLLFTGDLMLDRYIRQVAQQKGYDYILEDVTPLLLSKDLVIAGLEGPITTNKSVSIYSEIGSSPNFVFTFDPIVVSTFRKSNIKLVSLGNNHILNMGATGVAQTKKYLTESGVEFFGYTGTETTDRFLIKEIKGVKIAFVNYNQFVNGGKEAALEDIKKASDVSDLIILYTHWGVEYVPASPQYVQDLAHEFIDSGVDLIIGSHPHVVQQKEIYKGKNVYYSLGNFVMDQYFSAETKRGLLVGVDINPKDLSLTFTEYDVVMGLNAQTKLEVMGE